MQSFWDGFEKMARPSNEAIITAFRNRVARNKQLLLNE